ncbi:hypothetical protein LJR219_005198 [Phenylobacterium sp. LjRoot219]
MVALREKYRQERTLPNPHQERKVTNAHRNLAAFMGIGSPKLLNQKDG